MRTITRRGTTRIRRARSLALATLAAVTVVAAACTSPTGGGDPSPEAENEVTVTVDGQPVTVAGPTGSTLEVTIADPSTLPPSPEGTSFPLGAFTIDLSGIATGAVARVTITLPTSADSVRKLIGGAWDPFAHDGVTGAQLSGDGLTLTVDLQDGGRGDADGVANGTIHDPIAPVVDDPLPPHVTQVSMGAGQHACALISDGAVKCWGYNGKGALGLGFVGENQLVPQSVVGLDNAVQLDIGLFTTCAVKSDTTVVCWGWNLYGTNGNGGSGTNSYDLVPTPVPGLSGVASISTGQFTTCAVMLDTTARCWGWGYNGQLGNGATADTTTPVTVIGSGFKQIAVGDVHVCAVMVDSTVTCWGNDEGGQLGQGVMPNLETGPPLPDRSTPSTVPGIAGAVSVAAGPQHTCVVLGDNTTRCWGWGALGNGTGTPMWDLDHDGEAELPRPSPSPTMVNQVSPASRIHAGSIFGCVVTTAGGVECWGRSPGVDSPGAYPIAGVTDVVEVDGHGPSMCVLTSDSQVICWGNNMTGQLGRPGLFTYLGPGPVPGLP